MFKTLVFKSFWWLFTSHHLAAEYFQRPTIDSLNNCLFLIEFPTSMVTNDCLAVTKVKFLKDMETTCLADNIKPDYFTISSMYERLIHNQYIISSSELFNITWLNKISVSELNLVF